MDDAGHGRSNQGCICNLGGSLPRLPRVSLRWIRSDLEVISLFRAMPGIPMFCSARVEIDHVGVRFDPRLKLGCLRDGDLCTCPDSAGETHRFSYCIAPAHYGLFECHGRSGEV